MSFCHIFVDMAEPVRKTTQELYQTIREEYKRMSAPDKRFGIQKYTDRYIFAKIAKKYFRSVATIEAIVYGRL